MALLNDPGRDFELLLYNTGLKLKEIAAAVGRDPSNVRATVRAHVMNPRYIEAVETMGYDIEIVYIRKGDKRK